MHGGTGASSLEDIAVDLSAILSLSSIAAGTGVTDHGLLTGLADDDHPQYVLVTDNTNLSALAYNLEASAGAGVVDHGALTGLEDDDHPQYVLSATNANLSSLVNNHIASASVHFEATSIDHGGLVGLNDNDHPQYVLVQTNLNLSSTVNSHITSASVHFEASTVDHGVLVGLADNDHPQYVLSATNLALSTLVTAIQTSANTTSTLLGLVIVSANNTCGVLGSHIASASVHFTEASIDHGNIAGRGDDDHTQYFHIDGSRVAVKLSTSGFIGSSGTLTVIGSSVLTSSLDISGVTTLAARLKTSRSIVFSPCAIPTSAGTITLNWDNSNKHHITLSGATTFVFQNPSGAANLVLMMTQDGTGGRVVTWPGTVDWGSRGEPTWNTTLNKINIATFYYPGTGNAYYGGGSIGFG